MTLEFASVFSWLTMFLFLNRQSNNPSQSLLPQDLRADCFRLAKWYRCFASLTIPKFPVQQLDYLKTKVVAC